MAFSTPEHFFTAWIPKRFEELIASDAQLIESSCSLVAVIGDDSFVLDAKGGKLEVTQEVPSAPCVFRLHADLVAFDALLKPAMSQEVDVASLARLLRLDQESLDLIAGVPGCLKIEVKSETEKLSLVVGPGCLSADQVGCTIRCELSDLQALQAGTAQPIELLMNGRLEMDGDVQIAMALGGLLL